MRRIIALSLLLLAGALFMPMIAVKPAGTPPGAAVPLPPPTGTVPTSAQPAHSPGLAGQEDFEVKFTALIDGELCEKTLGEYLPGAVAGEMPASFEPEALKAQAVAARTYILYRMSHTNGKHPEADVCSDASCCKAYIGEAALRERWGEAYESNWEKIRSATAETDGQYLTYAGEPIQAVFHSSSAGMTESSKNLWQDVPYLVSVPSMETEAEVPNFVSSVEVTAGDFKATVQRLHPDAALDGAPALWLGEVNRCDSGRVESVSIGGVTVPGSELRSMFTLRSTSFSLDYVGESFLFTVRGYGHGVGMSQYGANTMAKSGAGYAEILSHYYPGTELVGGAPSS